MRKTIKSLEERISDLNLMLKMEHEEIAKLKAVSDAYKLVTNHIPAITIALERVTDAVAHVLTDLSRRSVR